MLPRAISAAVKRLVLRAGLAGYRFHGTRHAHATLMLCQGVHPKIVQESLSHTKIGTTQDIYNQVTPGLQQAAALRFEEGLHPPPIQSQARRQFWDELVNKDKTKPSGVW